jgi:hypothetical protein
MRFTKLMPGYRQMAAALPLVILFSCGAAPGSITQRSHAPVAFACPSPRPINEFGMTDEQRMEHHKWLTAHWEECYTRWESGITPP